MSSMRLPALLLVLALGGPGAPGLSAQEDAPGTVAISLEPQEVAVGDLVSVRIVVQLGPDSTGELDAPEWQERWGDAEIREVGPAERSDTAAGPRWTQTLTVTAFRPGPVELPQLRFEDALGRTLVSRPIAFTVRSVLPADGPAEPKPPAPPRPVTLGAAFWWSAGLLAVLALALGWKLAARARAGARPALAPIDPWTELEQGLDELRDGHDPFAVFTGLSIHLRRFLGRSLAFPAAESTTTELRRRLRRTRLSPGLGGSVLRLLEEADGVKFARRTPTGGRHRAALEEALAVAADIARELAPKESDGGPEAAEAA